MADVSLRALTREDWEECAALKVREDQEDFVDSNLFAIAETRFRPGWGSYAVYRGEEMVGMIVYSGAGCAIEHLMIDARFQGEGLGRAALLEALELARRLGGCPEVRLSYWPGNPAVGLYESVGFRHTGETWGDGEPVMALPL